MQVKIFLAAPYMQYYSPDIGVEPSFHNRISNIVAFIQKKEITVLSAFARENWVAHIDDPEDAVEYDFHGIEIADFIGVFIDNNDKYKLNMWISLDSDFFLNVTDHNSDKIIRYLFERYPY